MVIRGTKCPYSAALITVGFYSRPDSIWINSVFINKVGHMNRKGGHKWIARGWLCINSDRSARKWRGDFIIKKYEFIFVVGLSNDYTVHFN